MRRRWTKEDELRWEAAKSATICGQCFRPLAPTDSVTKLRPFAAPLCLLSTLTDIDELMQPVWFDCEPHWQRTRCLNCRRPLRLQPPSGRVWVNWRSSLNERCCCRDCQRAVRNKRNTERRRVEHAPRRCANPACGKTFIPKRDDAVTCSNRCRQALHRERQRAQLGGVKHPLRKPAARRERRAPR